MKIRHLSSYDIAGGAARAAYRLHRGLLQLGQDSGMVVAHKSSQDETVQELPPPPWRRRAWFKAQRLRRWFNRLLGYEQFSDDRAPYRHLLQKEELNADILHLHWVAGLLDYPDFFRHLPPSMPLVWSCHDMNLLTGGCHYDAGCGRYRMGCGRCPQLQSQNKHDRSAHVWQRKKQLLSAVPVGHLHMVAPSRWLVDELQQSPFFTNHAIHHIPYGVDTTTFHPSPRPVARRALGIPIEAKVVLFVAQLLNIRRKGSDLIEPILEKLPPMPNLHIISVGHGDFMLPSQFNHHHLGTVDDNRQLAMIYSAADLFILPSRQDNLPNTVLEALACGTPVIGFDVGGIPDMVRPGETGLLVPLEDINAYQQAIVQLLNAPQSRAEAMRHRCRELVETEYSLETQAQRYLTLYQTIHPNQG